MDSSECIELTSTETMWLMTERAMSRLTEEKIEREIERLVANRQASAPGRERIHRVENAANATNNII